MRILMRWEDRNLIGRQMSEVSFSSNVDLYYLLYYSDTNNKILKLIGCFVDNKLYGVGHVIESASSPCLECRCDKSGMMKCNPKECTPEDPLLQQINREVLQSTLSRSQVR